MKRYENTVVTIHVPWKQGADWPYLPAQELILNAMNELGTQGWRIVEHVWSTTPPADDTQLWPVNIWADRELPPA